MDSSLPREKNNPEINQHPYATAAAPATAGTTTAATPNNNKIDGLVRERRRSLASPSGAESRADGWILASLCLLCTYHTYGDRNGGGGGGEVKVKGRTARVASAH